jgi:HlyD family secretion protein
MAYAPLGVPMNKHVSVPADVKSRSTESDKGEGPLQRDLQQSKPSAEARTPKPEPKPDDQQTARPQDSRGDAGPSKNPAVRTQETNSENYWTWRRVGVLGLAIGLLPGALLWWWFSSTSGRTITYSVAKATHDNVVMTVRATGALEPRGAMDIVAPAGGRVENIAVKSGDRVIRGQTIAILASETARDALQSGQSEFVARQADLARAEADLAEARAAALRARDDKRPGAMDSAQARLARITVNVNEARDLVGAAQSNVASARASLQNLDVRAPIDGIVLKTNLETPGNTRAVLRGQTLLTMVPDVSQLNLKAEFVESSLGALHPGERAEFTSPAFPRRTFAASLSALEVWPRNQVIDGKPAVTYSGTLTAANPDGALRPGMSADIAIVIAEARGVLVGPTAALGFAPPPKIESQFPAAKIPTGSTHGRIWVLASGKPEPRDVTLGLSDGRITQVTGGALREGENVITGALVTTRGSQS